MLYPILLILNFIICLNLRKNVDKGDSCQLMAQQKFCLKNSRMLLTFVTGDPIFDSWLSLLSLHQATDNKNLAFVVPLNNRFFSSRSTGLNGGWLPGHLLNLLEGIIKYYLVLRLFTAPYILHEHCSVPRQCS